ncbi:unnamed protein product [Hymenolepis diminuta]|uniref:Uncharacterized protein n=1 Tax=Hymenolepis diminuta TaxID=6216 RepID=A0A564Y073_HYMDI|nr:unnamed protein product [Hymenolepis diminuta]
MNEVDIIAPSERFDIFEGDSMKKRVVYHFQDVSEQQTAESSEASAKTQR